MDKIDTSPSRTPEQFPHWEWSDVYGGCGHEGGIYTVKKADNLWNIAKDNIGPQDASNSMIEKYTNQIARDNDIKDKNKIYVNQELSIPLPCDTPAERHAPSDKGMSKQDLAEASANLYSLVFNKESFSSGTERKDLSKLFQNTKHDGQLDALLSDANAELAAASSDKNSKSVWAPTKISALEETKSGVYTHRRTAASITWSFPKQLKAMAKQNR